ncbi:MAG: hypothetical protein ACOCZ6_05300 [Nanoarchaeota archaeon]
MANNIVTHLILFIAVLGIATGVVISFKSFSDDAQTSMDERSKAFQAKLDTSFEVEVVHHNNETNITRIYSRNTGEKSHRIEDIGVYINGIRIPHKEENMTIEIVEETVKANEGEDIWDKGEKLFIKVHKSLEQGQVHRIIVTTPHEGRVTEEISV